MFIGRMSKRFDADPDTVGTGSTLDFVLKLFPRKARIISWCVNEHNRYDEHQLDDGRIVSVELSTDTPLMVKQAKNRRKTRKG